MIDDHEVNGSVNQRSSCMACGSGTRGHHAKGQFTKSNRKLSSRSASAISHQPLAELFLTPKVNCHCGYPYTSATPTLCCLFKGKSK